jgi:hypothetical protein
MSDVVADNNKNEIKTAPLTIVVHEEREDEKFKPKGAIAFFVLLMILCAVIWFGIYYIQLSRQ